MMTPRFLLIFLLAIGYHTAASAEGLPVDIYNFFRVEYDDNVFTTGDTDEVEPVESLVLIEQVELLLDTKQGNTYYGLRYSPSYHWYEDRPEDDDDWYHQWDLILEHDFSPRTSAQLKHTLRYTEESELVEDDVTFRNNNDFLYNAVVGYWTTQLRPDTTSVRVNGRFTDFSYEEDDVAEFNDYQEYGGGLDLIQNLSAVASIALNASYRELDYETDFRDAEVWRIATTYSRQLNPNLQTTLALGWEQQNSDDPVSEDVDSPFADISIVLLPGSSTRLTLGGGYGIKKSPVNIFSSQERAWVFGRLNQELSAAIDFMLQGTFSTGEFDEDSATSLFDPAVNSDGSEDTVQLLMALTYELNVRNSLELSWRYTELDSDVRPDSDYDRNRYYLGWKLRL